MPEFDKESRKLEPQVDGQITPSVERDVLAVNRARPQPQPVDKSSVEQVVTDLLKRTTLNGYPMDVQGGNITVAPAAMAVREAVAMGGGTIQSAVAAPQVLVSPVPTRSELLSANHRTILDAPVSTPNVSSRAGTGVRGRDPTLPQRNNTPALYRRPTDTTSFGSTLIPVKLKRADGERTIIAYLDAPSGYVVEGADTGERTESLPGKNTYYNASGSDGDQFGFALHDASDMDGHKVLVLDGHIVDDLPDGMGADDYILDVSTDSDIWAVITYDLDTFEITSRTLDIGADTPDNVDGTIYVTIGYVWFDSATPPEMHLRNAHCGNINALPFIAVGIANSQVAQAAILFNGPPELLS